MPKQQPNQEVQAPNFKVLPLTLSLETVGGIATPLVLRGTPLPTKRTQTFTTYADGQTAVDLHVLLGESPVADKNLSVQRFQLTGIEVTKRGQPQIEVTFDVDNACKVEVKATDKATMTHIEILTRDAQPHLSAEKVEELLHQAQQGKALDEEFLKEIDLKNQAASMIEKAEAYLSRNRRAGGSESQHSKIEELLASLGLALEADDSSLITNVIQELKSSFGPTFFPSFSGIFGSPSSSGVFDSFFGPFNKPAGTPVKSPSKQGEPKTRTRKGPEPEPQGPNPPTSAEIPNHASLGKIFGGGTFATINDLCFVLMPFEESMRAIYNDHLRPAIQSEGMSCLRADEIVGTNMITRQIWEKINQARCVVADLTHKNPNVFYEVGVAHALGKDVILVTQSMTDVPFDLQALRCIVYEFTPRGMKALESKLRATIKELLGTQ